MRSIEELEEKQEKIKRKIYEIADENYDTSPIADGIVNVQLYNESKMKILWLLKETYGDSGDYSIGQKFANQNFEKELKSSRMMKNIVHISYSLLNNFITWDDLLDVRRHPDIAKVLNQIAYINISKIPGESKSDARFLNTAYSLWRDVLLDQIEICRPNIAIFGGTYEYYKSDLSIPADEFKRMDYGKYALYNNTLYFDVYHPAYVMD